MTQGIDRARLTLMLNDLRLPAIKQDWPALAERADKESWPAARFLATLAEHEIAERDRRRLARHLAEAQLLPGKTLDSFDFDVVPMLSKARVLAPIYCSSADPAAARRIWPPPSASRWWKTAGACCSPAPPTWSSGSRSPAANWRSRPPSTGSIASIC